MATQPATATRAEFARLLGVRASYITKLAQQGRLVFTPDGKRVRVEESKTLIEATKGSREDVAARHAEERSAPSAADEPEDEKPDASLTEARRLKVLSEARRLAALADQEEMNRDKQAGALLAREDVDFVLADFGATLHRLLENLPDRLAPQVYPLTTLEETHAVISEAAEDLQREMAETMRRRVEGMIVNG